MFIRRRELRTNFVRVAVILIPVTVTFAAVGCFRGGGSAITPDDNTTSATAVSANTSSLPVSQYVIQVLEVGTIGSQYIYFRGTAPVLDGTVLLSQLSADDTPLPWWPASQPIKVAGGLWDIKVPLGVNGAPNDLPVSLSYHFSIWQQDAPSIKGLFPFDFIGPPALPTGSQ